MPRLTKDQPYPFSCRNFKRNKLLVALVLALSIRISAADESTSAAPGNGGATQLTQAELDAQKRKLEREADTLEQSRKNCEDLLDDIKHYQETEKTEDDKSAEIALLSSKLSNAQTQYASFTDLSKPPRDLPKSISELSVAFRTLRTRLALTGSGDVSLDDERLRTVPRQLARELVNKAKAAQTRSKPDRPSLDKVQSLVEQLETFAQQPDAAHLKTGAQSLLTLFDDATKQVASLPEAVKKYLAELSAVTTAVLREYETLLETEINRIKEAQKTNQDQQNRLLKQLGTLEQQQTYLDSRLMYILLCMMGTVLAMLVIVRWRGDRVSELIVRERTAVEILSIGMFLSTIMYLSAARYIEKTILGTLLGTLAGYLFTRRSQSSTPDETPTIQAPGIPSQPAFDQTTRTLSLRALPPRTDFLKAFIRDTTTGASEELGTTQTKEFVIAADKLKPGNTYELSFTASNATGDSKPGPPLKVTV